VRRFKAQTEEQLNQRFKAKTQEQLNQKGGTVENITNLVTIFKFDEILNYYNTLNLTNFGIFSKLLNDLIILINPSTNISNLSWIRKAKTLAINYMTKLYDTSRKMYYDKVKTAEELLSQIDLDRNNKIPKDVRLNLMTKIAEALVFRAESYVSPSTVMHVVRVLQAQEQLDFDEKCGALKIPKSKAQCALGKYGYAMSCLEQIGCLYRFDKTYCQDILLNGKSKNDHKDAEKCVNKRNKYLPRLKDGLNRMNNLTVVGGKRNRRYSKKLFKRVKTQRLKRTSRQNKRRNIKYSRKLK
jgi:hypothetical protein